MTLRLENKKSFIKSSVTKNLTERRERFFLIFGLGIARGFGKEITPQFHMHEQKILNIAWALAAFLPFIGTLCYGFIIGLSEMDMSEWDNYGFGFMWWSMMMFSFLFAGLVYSQQISSMISRFKQVPAK